MAKIVLLQVDDWECLYVDGIARRQNHNIPKSDLVELCPIESMIVRWANPKLEDFVTDDGYFPNTLDESLEIENG